MVEVCCVASDSITTLRRSLHPRSKAHGLCVCKGGAQAGDFGFLGKQTIRNDKAVALIVFAFRHVTGALFRWQAAMNKAYATWVS